MANLDPILKKSKPQAPMSSSLFDVLYDCGLPSVGDYKRHGL
jgi:hypothetical protein